MPYVVALVGGDEFRPGCLEMDRAILAETGAERPRVVVVPTAAAAQDPSKAAQNGVSYFNGLGADASALMVLQAHDADDEALLSPVDDAHLVYFTGGDPAHLLEALEGSLLLRKVRQALDRGAIFAGSSAGAMVAGSWMRYRSWRKGLGIVPVVATLPHHESSDPNAVAKDLRDYTPSGVTVLGVDAMTCCLAGAGGWKVLGAGAVTLYKGGGWTRFESGQRLPLSAITSATGG